MIERVGVVGAGTMGAGIAQIAALGGFEVWIFDPVAGATKRGLDRIRGDLERGHARGRWSAEDAEAAWAHLHPAQSVTDLSRCELVIEAALSVTAIAAGVKRPRRVVGMHFFNPPALMRLVEVVAGAQSAERAVAAAIEVAEAMGERRSAPPTGSASSPTAA